MNEVNYVVVNPHNMDPKALGHRKLFHSSVSRAIP